MLSFRKHVCMDFSGGSDGKESACNAGDLGLIPGLERCSGGGRHAKRPRFPGPLLIRTRWQKARETRVSRRPPTTHLQEIFPIQGSNPGLLHCRQILHHLSHQRTSLQVLCLQRGHQGGRLKATCTGKNRDSVRASDRGQWLSCQSLAPTVFTASPVAESGVRFWLIRW